MAGLKIVTGFQYVKVVLYRSEVGSAWFFGADLLFFMPGGGFPGPGSDFRTPRLTFWPGDFLFVIWRS